MIRYFLLSNIAGAIIFSLITGVYTVLSSDIELSILLLVQNYPLIFTISYFYILVPVLALSVFLKNKILNELWTLNYTKFILLILSGLCGLMFFLMLFSSISDLIKLIIYSFATMISAYSSTIIFITYIYLKEIKVE